MFELTTPQKNIWNLQHFYEGTSIANVCGALFFEEKCDHELLNRAINKLIELQDGMRLQFTEADGEAVQYIAEYHAEKFTSEFFADRAAFEAYAQNYAQTPFEQMDSPMYRFVIFDLENVSGVLLCVSHLISDAWAVNIIAGTVYNWYMALESGDTFGEKRYSCLPVMDAEKDYFSSSRYEKDKVFWEKQYPARPEISCVKLHAASASKPTAKRYTTWVSAELSSELDQFCEQNQISQVVLFEAAIMTYLSRLNPENQRVSLGMLVLNRTSAYEKNAVANCISTIPLTVDVSPDISAVELLTRIRLEHYTLFRHQRFPYSHILRSLHDRYGFQGNLYDVLVSYQNAQTGVKAKTQWFSNGLCEVGLEFHIDNRDDSDRYTLNIDYQTELFHQPKEIELLVKRIIHILVQIIRDPSESIADIAILPEEEERLVIHDFNDTKIDYDTSICVHELFMRQAAQTPDKTALVFGEVHFTYRQLDDMSNTLAHHLREKGIGRGAIVPIASDRNWKMIVAMLGVLKAGAAYMHIDISYPDERIRYMLETISCSLCLTHRYTISTDVMTLSLDDFDFGANTAPVENLSTSDDLCYVIFTSGSTGKPKGLMISHRNVVNYTDRNRLNVYGQIITDPDQSILAITSTGFDIFVTESLLPLVNGITVFLADDKQILSQQNLQKVFERGPVRIMQTTPTKLRIYLSDKTRLSYLNSIEAFILGGEALPSDLYEELRSITTARIYNNYGPAETTVWSTIKEMRDEEITIGKPIANTQIYILDAKGKPLPIGAAGELCISGEGVGKGYLNRPELTAERFIPNPFIPGTTMYRTGDLARWRVDGEIEYLGRIDTQVKIRGLRIELGEIESVMNQFEGIRLAAAADKKDETGWQYLVGYYTAESEIDEKALRRHLSAKLPQYMIPNYFVRLDEMPMTGSGKTDRKTLPVPELGGIAREYAAPETEQEKILCAVLENLFQMERISVADDFFELGGDSLRAIEYVAKAHNEGISFALQNVFEYPTVQQLCAFMNGNSREKVAYSKEDLLKYQPILEKNVIDQSFIPEKKPLGNVFLTGATGFLGSHIIDRMMKEETGRIYCLVRGGRERLASVLEYYFGNTYTGDIGNRIIAVDGDITRSNLADKLPEDIQTVIHTAATVKHYGSYDYFHGVNVQGTKNVIAYAQRTAAKLIHVSTLSVSGNSLADNFDVYRSDERMEFCEQSLYIGQPLDNVYIHSKFEAELAVLDAALGGLDIRIVRVGNLTNRVADFKFQPNYRSNAFLTRVKAALEFGYLPDYLLPLYAEFSPIDQTAEGVVRIAQYADAQTVFHLNNHKNLYFSRMIDVMRMLGIHMDVAEGDAFARMLQKLARDADTAYIYEAFQNDLDESGRLVYDSNIHIFNDFTVWFMRKCGFEWEEIDYDYMKGYVDYFRRLGYFEV